MNKKQAKKTMQQQASIKKGMQINASSKNFKYTNFVGIAIIVLLGVIIYSNSFNCSFHFDDLDSIINNPTIKDLSNIKAWWNYSVSRPIAYFTFAVNYHYGQLNVWGYHLVNLIIHLTTSCIVMWLTLLLFSTLAMKDQAIIKHKKPIAILMALLFVSHPLATQSVTYIVQRLASMVAMFYLLSLALYIKGRLVEKGGISKYFLFVGALISAVLALLTKENAFTLPFSIVLIEIFFLRTKKFFINFKDYRVILLLTVLLCVVMIIPIKYSFNIFAPILPAHGNTYTVTPSNYLLTQFSVIVKYIQLLLLPIHQNVDYDFRLATSFFEIRTIVSFLILVSLVILGIFLFKKYRILSFGIFWFFITLSIESSIIPITDLIFEHRTYLPSFGFFLVLCAGIFYVFLRKRTYLAYAIIVIIIGSNSFLTYARNKIWKNDLTLWSDVVAKSPNKARPFLIHATTIQNLNQWENAIREYSKAIVINPKYTDAYYNRGMAYEKFKQWDKAIADYTKVLAIDPKYDLAWYNRGAAYGNIGQWDKAIADNTRMVERNPKYANAWYNRGVAYGKLEQFENAIADYTQVVKINPKYASAYCNRGAEYANNRQWGKAIADYSSAIAADPNYFNAYMNRAIAHEILGHWKKAVADYSNVIGINPNYKEAYVNRGSLYAKQGLWDNAMQDFAKALEIDPNYLLAKSNFDIANKKLNNQKK